MNIFAFLLLVVPVLFAVLFQFGTNRNYYKLLSYLLFFVCAVFSIMLALNGTNVIPIDETISKIIQGIMIVVEVSIIVFLFYVSTKHKKLPIFILTIIQTILTIYTTLFMPKGQELTTFNIDGLTLAMLLIINIVGTAILVFANGYMDEYEHHRHMQSRQRLFYTVVCIFLGAMNGLVLSDSLEWVYFFWEITTLSSFLLISYNKDAEAFKSGFRALFINLIGGLCFSLGIIILEELFHIGTFTQLISAGHATGFAVIPIFLLCIAGFSKSAQMPFQSWLLGAMVAPTPVSALLHSSTMVKAGVYLIIKLVPTYAGTGLGTAIALYGALTFLICSAIAISQRNAKRILAYSTIANLGLIICSAGMGSGIAVAASIILLVFHAVSKALLFLCTGQIEHTIGSRDVEDMTGLIAKAPTLAMITSFGLISMILPPFGVLVSKLVSIEASATNPIIVILVILGSALTTLYYIKWIGTMLAYPINIKEKTAPLNFTIYAPLFLLSILVVATSIFIEPIYNTFVYPEIKELLPKANLALSISNANVNLAQLGNFNNETIFIIIGILLIFAFIIKGFLVNRTNRKTIYMCGENNLEDENMFRIGDGTYSKAVVGNIYLNKLIDEKSFTILGNIISVALILFVLLGGLL